MYEDKKGKLLNRIVKIITRASVVRVLSPVLILLVWEAIARSGLIMSVILPAPSTIFITLFRLIANGELLPHIYISLFRAIAGFIVGSVLGIFLGLMMGWSRFIQNIMDIPFNILRAVPISALVALFTVWFGIGEFPKILVISLPPFILAAINTMAGVKSVDVNLVRAAMALGAKSRNIVTEVVIPAALPSIYAALRYGAVISLVVLVVAEMTAAEKGLGAYIMETQRLFYTDKMFAGIILLAIFGYGMDVLIRKWESKTLRWHKDISSTRDTAKIDIQFERG